MKDVAEATPRKEGKAVVSDSGPRTAMLIINNGSDVRVLKEAVSLAEAGYRIRIFGRLNEGDSLTDTLQGIDIERVVPINSADTLWYYMRRSAMPLRTAERLRLMRTFCVWKIAGFRMGAKFETRLRSTVFPPRPPRWRRIVFRPMQTIEAGISYAINRVLRLPPSSLRQRIMKKAARSLGDPMNLFIRNEHLIYALTMYDTVRRFNPELVHAHDLYMLRAGAMLKDGLGCKLVYDSHEYERDRVRSYPEWRKKLNANEETRHITRTDAVITVSDSIADRLVEHYGIAKPNVIFNTSFNGEPYVGICDRRFTSLRQIIGLYRKTPLVVHIGKLFDMHRQTGQFSELIQAMAYLDDTHLALLGPNTEKAKVQVRDWAERYDVAERIHVVDPVPYPYVASFISDASLGIVAMHGDNLNTEYAMPNKLFEMALAHIPIIASDQTEIRNFVTNHARGLVVNCNDPRAIADAIGKICASPDEFRYTQEQKAVLLNSFSWPAQARKLEGVYGPLLGKRA